MLIASPARSEPPEVRAFLESIGGWINAGTDLRVIVVADNRSGVPLDLTLRATMHRSVSSRSALQNLMDSGVGSRAITVRLTSAVRPVAANARVRLQLRTPWAALGRPRVGVYPLNLRLEAGGETVWQALTAVAVTEGAPSGRLRVATIIPFGVEAPPVREDGAYDEAALQAFRQDALLAVADAANAGAGTALAPVGSTLDALAALASGAITRDATGAIVQHAPDGLLANQAFEVRTALRTATARHAPTHATYVRTDPAWLRELGYPEDLARHLDESATATRTLLGREPSNAVALLDATRLDAADLASVPDRSIVVVPDSALGPRSDEPFFPDLFGTSTPLLLEDRWIVLSADARASELAERLPAAEAAQGILMESAVRWLELPLFAPDRLFVFAPPHMPNAQMLRRLLRGLATAPWVSPTPLRSITTTAGTLATAPPLPDVDPSPLPELGTAHQTLAFARSTFPLQAGQASPLLDWNRTLLVGERVTPDGTHGDPELLTTLTREIERALREVHPAAARRVTLTSRSGVVPVVLVNANLYSATVQMRVSGRRVVFPDGPVQTVELPPGDTTIELAVEVLGRGEFPITVELRTLDGQRLSSASVTLRSTQVSGVALILVGGGVLFLLAQGVRRRRSRIPSAS